MMKFIKNNVVKFSVIILSLCIVTTFGIIQYSRTNKDSKPKLNTILNNRPNKVHKIFDNAFVTVDREKMYKTTNLEINADLFKGKLIEGTSVRQDLIGTIKIDNKNYSLKACNAGSHTNNCFFGDVKESPTDTNPKYVVFIFDNLNSIYLAEANDKEFIAAPAKTLDEFKSIGDKMVRKK